MHSADTPCVCPSSVRRSCTPAVIVSARRFSAVAWAACLAVDHGPLAHGAVLAGGPDGQAVGRDRQRSDAARVSAKCRHQLRAVQTPDAAAIRNRGRRHTPRRRHRRRTAPVSVLHWWISLSALAEKTCRPSGSTATALTACECPSNTRAICATRGEECSLSARTGLAGELAPTWPVSSRHWRTVVSALPEKAKRPSAETASAVTARAWPRSTWVSLTAAASVHKEIDHAAPQADAPRTF